MRFPNTLLLAVFFALVAVPTRTALSATPASTPTQTPAATATPAANQISRFWGSCWLNGRPCSGQTMTARIAGNICATSSIAIVPPDSTNRVIFNLPVPSRDVVPGCGFEGATVDFFVGDQQTSLSGTWHASAYQFILFIAGPRFALLAGTIDRGGTTSNGTLVPYVNGNACGYSVLGGSVTPDSYEAAVFSDQQQQGCGTEGARVSFRFLDTSGNIVATANETATWHAWVGGDEMSLNLTLAPSGGVTGPKVGTGGAAPAQSNPWTAIAMALSVAGLLGTTAGVALRRRRVSS